MPLLTRRRFHFRNPQPGTRAARRHSTTPVLHAESLEQRHLMAVMSAIDDGVGAIPAALHAARASEQCVMQQAVVAPVSLTAISAPGTTGSVRRNATQAALASTRTPLEIHFSNDFYPEGFKSAFEYAAGIWADLIQSTVPIRIDVALGNLSPSELAGTITKAAVVPGTDKVLAALALVNSLNGRPSQEAPDMTITFNRAKDFYYGRDGNVPTSQYSFVTVALHEIAHGLGFTLGLNGSALLRLRDGKWYAGSLLSQMFARDNHDYKGYWYQFMVDGTFAHLKDEAAYPFKGQNGLTDPKIKLQSGFKLGAALTTGNVFFDGPNARAANNGMPVRLHAPSEPKSGESWIHLDRSFQTSADGLMTSSGVPGPGGYIPRPGKVTLGILRDLGWKIRDVPMDPSLSVAATSADKPEGNTGSTPFKFTVTRSGTTSGTSAVSWAVTGNGANAANPDDFAGSIFPSGTVTFAAGETSKVVRAFVRGDEIVEADEGFKVTLSTPVGATIANPVAAGVIRNDDTVNPVVPPSLAIAATDASKTEGEIGQTAFTFTVTRSGNVEAASSTRWAVTGDGPNPADFFDFGGLSLPSGTVAFAAGETSKVVTVNVAGDLAVEADEGFAITLGSPVNAAISAATATGVIRNDDLNRVVNAPSNVRADNVWSDKVDVAWNDNSNDETGFNVYYSTNRGVDWIFAGNTAANAVRFRVQGLTASQPYVFGVQAVNGNIASGIVPSASVTTLPRPRTSVSNVGRTSFTLNWRYSGSKTDHFEVWIEARGTWRHSEDVPRDKSSALIEFEQRGGGRLRAGEAYRVRMRAVDSAGRATSDWSEEMALRMAR